MVALWTRRRRSEKVGLERGLPNEKVTKEHNQLSQFAVTLSGNFVGTKRDHADENLIYQYVCVSQSRKETAGL